MTFDMFSASVGAATAFVIAAIITGDNGAYLTAGFCIALAVITKALEA